MMTKMNHAFQSPELNLLLKCALHNHQAIEDLANQPAYRHSFSEKEFLFWVQRHRLQGLIAPAVERIMLFTDTARAQLREWAQHNTMMALSSLEVMKKLQAFVDQNSFKAFFLKGVGLSANYYGAVGLRHVYDIDIWVEPHAQPHVEHFIRTLGYVNENDRLEFNDTQLRYLQQGAHDAIFLPSTQGIQPIIELHWKLRDSLGNFLFDPVREYNRLESIDLGSFEIKMMNEVDQFIFLCVHGADHGWFRIKWLVDLYWVQKKSSLNWMHVQQRAKQLNALDEVVLAFAVLNSVMGVETPSEFPMKRRSWLQHNQLRYIHHLIAYKGVFCDTPWEKLKNALYTLTISKRFFPSAELIKRNLTNKTDWLILRLPEPFFFLYFPLRPFLWIYRKLKN